MPERNDFVQEESLRFRFANTGTLEELYEVVEGLGSLQTPGREYSVDEIRTRVEMVISGEKPIEVITRYAGLRSVIERLAEEEKQRRLDLGTYEAYSDRPDDETVAMERLDENSVQVSEIGNAGDFEELKEVLELMKVFRTSRGLFSSQDVIKAIELVRAGKEKITIIPRTYGLRQKVINLLEDK